MLTVKTANRDNAQKKSVFEQLPKGAYVIKIVAAREEENKSGKGRHVAIAFDIAEGEYKDFYKQQFDANTNEDKKWPMDAVFNLNEPDENSADWMQKNWDTFWTDVEDSNPGYRFDGDEKRVKGLLVGGKMRIEQSEYNDNIYDHTRLCWTCMAQDVRDGKAGKLPKDKLIDKTVGMQDINSFVAVKEGDAEIPF